jgi:hypothetical protein
MRLALLSMSGSDLTLDLLFQLRVESSRLDVLQLNLGSKVDVAKRMENFSHHGVEARRVHAIDLVGLIGHGFLLLFLLLGPRDGGINLD